MDQSICIQCNLFTLAEKNVEENKYVNIFEIWLRQLILKGGLYAKDVLHLYIDTRTIEFCNKNPEFHNLLSKLPCPVKVFVFPPPNTLLEGTMYRFVYHEYEQDIYMYCDIDILVIRPIHLLLQPPQHNTLYVHVEGCIEDENYGAAFSKEEIAKLHGTSPGCSSGKFILNGKEFHKMFFERVNILYKQSNKLYYTLDQPYYNKAIYTLDTNVYKINIDLFQAPHLSINGHGFTDQTILLDCMGKPGDQDFHYDKIKQIFGLKN